MSDTLIVIKRSRLRRVPRKDWLMLLVVLAASAALLIGSFCAYPRLTKENTHKLTGPVSDSRIIENRSRHGSDTAVLVIDGEEYRIPIKSRELRQLMERRPTGTARIIATDQNEIAELEYDGTIYHTLAKENADRLGIRFIFLVFSLLFLAGDLFLLALVLFGSVIILRKRPKNIKKRILIEK